MIAADVLGVFCEDGEVGYLQPLEAAPDLHGPVVQANVKGEGFGGRVNFFSSHCEGVVLVRSEPQGLVLHTLKTPQLGVAEGVCGDGG